MLSGRVLIDLRNVEPERARGHLACLSGLPAGVRVDLLVGALKANPEACRVIAEQVDRLEIDVAGQPWAVTTWLKLVREPDVLTWDAS